MSWIIVYRKQDSGKIYCVVSDNAYGLREFDAQQEAADYTKRVGYMDDATVRFVEVP